MNAKEYMESKEYKAKREQESREAAERQAHYDELRAEPATVILELTKSEAEYIACALFEHNRNLRATLEARQWVSEVSQKLKDAGVKFAVAYNA
jgi:hypothetical protein